MLQRINVLIKDILQTPFQGKGKPEPLKYKGLWSRGINDEHRLIYRIMEDELQILKCRFHYD